MYDDTATTVELNSDELDFLNKILNEYATYGNSEELLVEGIIEKLK